MEGKVFLAQYLIWVMLLLGQLRGCKSCTEKDRMALLELKKYIFSISIEGQSDSALTTWTNDTKDDCCLWEGIECNSTSGLVIEIIFTISWRYFKQSSLLNLSLLHPFEEVRSLQFSDYSAGYGLSGLFDDVEGYNSLKILRNLKILDLSYNSFNNSIFPFLKAATSLTTLHLRSNDMDGSFPVKEIRDLTNLELLDLSRNGFSGSIPVQELSALRNLKALNLGSNEFSGSMELQGICKLKNIQELDLRRNKLVGQVPPCLTRLTELRVLDLSSNQLTGKVPSALGSLKSLEYLSLFDNEFEGSFSFGSIANLSKLKVLKLGSKSNSLQVVLESSWKPEFQLSVIELRSCNLEKVPHFLLHQKDLRHVDLSDNIISGMFPSWLLANNTKLVNLRLQNNSLTSFQLPKSAHHSLRSLNVSVNKFNHVFPENLGWILPRLQYMDLAMNGFQGNLPSSLGNMKKIKHMDLSHNSFQGKLPRSFLKGCEDSLEFLKLSHNKLSGEIFPESANFTRLWMLSMDNNLFTGKVSQGLRRLTSMFMLDISNNNLTGVIPSWIGEFRYLIALWISSNFLEGEIPVSLFSISPLRLLDLSANSLSGDIPPHVNSTYGLVLLLQDNNLSGVIPDALLSNVKVLDLRNNRLSGNIPDFINTQNISILLLRGNYLTGHIPRQLCGLSNIQILDLANNRLNGSIPSCLTNTSFVSGIEDTAYDNDYDVFFLFIDFKGLALYFESQLMLEQYGVEYKAGAQLEIKFATKHRYDAYMGKNLKLLFGIDLSENELSGEIPVDLGGLNELQALNLSHNQLSGVIPQSFSGLKNVESLDLSFNRLHGRIPPQLTTLHSLAVFNVSYNNLSGVIPHGSQFNTFEIQSYYGNHFLCGQPTKTSCNSNNFQEPDDEVEADESLIDMVSFYWSFAAAYVTILLGILASLSFDSPWSRAWFYIVYVFIHKAKNLLW